jgi:hypothetical protein
MKKFSDFGIQPTTKSFSGEKIKIAKLLNKKIIVEDYKVEDSKYEGKGKCLYLQIRVDGEQRVVFTSGKTLIEILDSVPQDGFPFETTIVEENERLLFK